MFVSDLLHKSNPGAMQVMQYMQFMQFMQLCAGKVEADNLSSDQQR